MSTRRARLPIPPLSVIAGGIPIGGVTPEIRCAQLVDQIQAMLDAAGAVLVTQPRPPAARINPDGSLTVMHPPATWGVAIPKPVQDEIPAAQHATV